MEWLVPLSDLDYGEDEASAVQEVLANRWLTMGAVTERFENQFAEFVGVRNAIAVSNATAALHLACLSLGIGPGDEVIVPSLSFVATANAVLYCGAQPRFADITSPHEPNISPQSIEAGINPRTKAIIVMHYAGYPCRMAEILEIASHSGLSVIEDAAHAPGASLDGRALGSWGDVGCFSFFSNKNLATGEGGMLVTGRRDLAESLRRMRSHGMTSLTWDRHQGHAYSYDVVDLGYNYRLDELRAALGLVQLDKLAANNARRSQITEQYWRELEGRGLDLPFHAISFATGFIPACHIFPVLLPGGLKQGTFMEHLRSKGVQTSIHYPPIHRFSYYRNCFPDIQLPNTETFASREITLPLFPHMLPEQFDLVVRSVIDAL